MIRLIWTRILLCLVILILVSAFFLLGSAPPPLRDRGRGGGELRGYRDCSPAHQVVLLQRGPSDSYSRLLEQILTNFALQHQLNTGRQLDVGCNIFFFGISQQSVNCSNLAGLRQSVGEQTYIISVSDQALAKLVGADFNFISKVFKKSLLILRHLLCMEFRDILFFDNLDQTQSLKEYEDDDFNNIISYLGEDFLNKQMELFNRILNNSKQNL